MVSFICPIIKFTQATQRITQSQPSWPYACLCRACQMSGPQLLGSGQRWPCGCQERPQPCWGEATARPILWPWGLLPAQALLQGLAGAAEATMLWPAWGCPLLPADLCLSPSPGKGLVPGAGAALVPPMPCSWWGVGMGPACGPCLATDIPSSWPQEATGTHSTLTRYCQ